MTKTTVQNSGTALTIQKKLLRFIAEWQSLSLVTFFLYWLLWYIVDAYEYEKDGYAWNVLLFDYAYCSSFTLCALAVCRSIAGCLAHWMKKRRYFIFASAVSLTVTILIAILFENTVNKNERDKVVLEGVYIYTLIATFLSLIILSNHNYELYIAELESHKRNKLAILKQQFNPHFMFNNLNTLDALIESDKETAHLYLNKLSQCYRYIVKSVNVDAIEISTAIDFVKIYNDLLQISIPGHFNIEIEPGLKQNRNCIVPMSLQLLIENAVKHNRHSQKEPVGITIKSDGEYIAVTNTYRPIKQSVQSTGTGLLNLCRHSLYITGKDCLISRTDGSFEVRIPIIKKEPK